MTSEELSEKLRNSAILLRRGSWVAPEWFERAVEEIERLEKRVKELSLLLSVLSSSSRELCPDYPSIETDDDPSSQLWALTSSIEGTRMANDDLHAYIESLKSQITNCSGPCSVPDWKAVQDAIAAESAK